jgi:protocatechuate 3,4-dioxygenase beta subunit
MAAPAITKTYHWMTNGRYPEIPLPRTLHSKTSRKARLMNQTAVTPALAARRTPGLLLGPYYPLQAPASAGAELWRGETPPVGARRLRFDGRVLAGDGTPVADAHIELWHADPAGHYCHPSAPDHALVLPGFAGYGTARSDAQGRFFFCSLVPGGYVDGGVARVAHLHVQITGRVCRLVTQVFLPGQERNHADRWYRAVAQPERLLPEVVRDDANALHLNWTAFIAQA